MSRYWWDLAKLQPLQELCLGLITRINGRVSMETIRLTRISRDGKAVRGIMRAEGQEYATLENADYIIPVGTYEVRVTYSPRFKRMLPLVEQVPGRSGIRFHRGTRPEHSKGCILVSAAKEQELTAKWLALQASNEPIKITIEYETRE